MIKQKLLSICVAHPRLLASCISIGIGFTLSIVFGIAMNMQEGNDISFAFAEKTKGSRGDV